MEYRTSFFIQVIAMMLNNSAFIIFWLIIFNRLGGDIRGYGFQDVMFLWAVTAVGYGFAEVFLGNSQQISRIIYQGELDVYLLQPKPVLPNLLASRMVVSGWGDILYGIILYLFSQPVYAEKILLFLIFSFLVCTVFVAVRVFYHSLTFFTGNAEDFAATASELTLTFSLYPGSIFQGTTSFFLHTIFPAALVAYIPAELFTCFSLQKFLILIAGDTAIVIAAIVMFGLGLHSYESGNRIGTRL